MAGRHINTKNGLITLPTGANGVFRSFEVNESYGSEDVSVYGSSLVYGEYLTNGTPIQTVSVNGFAQTGAASTSPGFGAMTDHDGVSCTITYDTGSTLVGSYVVSGIRTSHDRSRAAVPTTWSLLSSSDIVTTWATT